MGLFVRKQGLGAMVRRITIEVDLQAALVPALFRCRSAVRYEATVQGAGRE
jgi:hypothetical protein